MGRVDWDALKAAAAEAAVLMIVLTSASLLYIFSLVMAALVGPWLSLVAFVTIFILLTAVMYKYESSVNEEDN
jgi:membrane protein implicated in regulation of membrane protease activity